MKLFFIKASHKGKNTPSNPYIYIFDGSSEHVALAGRKIGLFGKKNPVCDCFTFNQMALTDQIKEMA